ncbi:BIG/ATPase V1 complex, subunit S1 [Pyronema omphalodes]|nr:BIG/ATPase V1 complex, subunit S1 [Pyronema omphalodes]
MRSIFLSIALAASVHAFSDTSPYILVSSSSGIPDAPRTHRILSSTTFAQAAKEVVTRCDADNYILVSQPGLHIEDLSQPHSGVHLKDLLSSVDEEFKWVASNVFVPSVEHDMGSVIESLQHEVVEKCGARLMGVDAKTGSLSLHADEGKRPRILRVDFDRLPQEGQKRVKMVEQHDAFLHSVLDLIGRGKYTLVYASSPIAAEKQVKKTKQEKVEEIWQELELRSVLEEGQPKTNETQGGLFHRYQFFTPGIFMGYIAFFVLAGIFYVGLSAVSSIKVSYGSFDKDMGPAAQKKQQ